MSLTRKDLEKLSALERLKSKKIRQIDTAKLLNKSERQIRRLSKKYLDDEAKGFILIKINTSTNAMRILSASHCLSLEPTYTKRRK